MNVAKTTLKHYIEHIKTITKKNTNRKIKTQTTKHNIGVAKH